MRDGDKGGEVGDKLGGVSEGWGEVGDKGDE